MKYEAKLLWEQTPLAIEGLPLPTIQHFAPEKQRGNGAVVVFPGGGYQGLADHEGSGYAQFLNEQGLHAFVVYYRVAPYRFPCPLLDARRAVRLVRSQAQEWGIDPQKIAVMGSSAGGHLAALVSTYPSRPQGEGTDAIDMLSCLPNAQILCYPVIETKPGTVGHIGSGFQLLGVPPVANYEQVTPTALLNPNAPQAFIWHTHEDGSVNVINSYSYATRMRELGIPVEMHIYPHGHHGLGLRKIIPHTARWAEQLVHWLRYIGYLDV